MAFGKLLLRGFGRSPKNENQSDTSEGSEGSSANNTSLPPVSIALEENLEEHRDDIEQVLEDLRSGAPSAEKEGNKKYEASGDDQQSMLPPPAKASPSEVPVKKSYTPEEKQQLFMKHLFHLSNQHVGASMTKTKKSGKKSKSKSSERSADEAPSVVGTEVGSVSSGATGNNVNNNENANNNQESEAPAIGGCLSSCFTGCPGSGDDDDAGSTDPKCFALSPTATCEAFHNGILLITSRNDDDDNSTTAKQLESLTARSLDLTFSEAAAAATDDGEGVSGKDTQPYQVSKVEEDNPSMTDTISTKNSARL